MPIDEIAAKVTSSYQTDARPAFTDVCREVGYSPDPAFLQHLKRQRQEA
jgi:hypothetical protein